MTRTPTRVRKVHVIAVPTDSRTVCGRDRDAPEVRWADLSTEGPLRVTCRGCLGGYDRHRVCPRCGCYVPERADGTLASHTATGGSRCPESQPV